MGCHKPFPRQIIGVDSTFHPLELSSRKLPLQMASQFQLSVENLIWMLAPFAANQAPGIHKFTVLGGRFLIVGGWDSLQGRAYHLVGSFTNWAPMSEALPADGFAITVRKTAEKIGKGEIRKEEFQLLKDLPL
eukprot:721249-Amphidinium_carterae.1